MGSRLSFLGICFLLAFLLLLCVHAYNLCKAGNFTELKTRSSLLLVLELSLFFARSTTKKRVFSPILVLSISHFICVFWERFGDCYALIVSGDPFLGGEAGGVEGRLVQISVRIVAVKLKMVLSSLKENKAKKFIEFAVRTVGAILFQFFFKVTSMKEVAAFLYFAVMWLANLSLLGVSGDFGVFNFLLTNGVVGCTVGEFGLNSATWLALGASLLLYAFRLKLESLTVPYQQGQSMHISFCGLGHHHRRLPPPPDLNLTVSRTRVE